MPKKGKDVGNLVQACLSGETKNALAILKKGTPIDACDAQGNHALVAACCGGHLELVKDARALVQRLA